MKISYWELPFRSIPESLLFIYAVYVFTSKKLDIKKWLISSILLAVITFGTRMFLPIQAGVHTFILAIMIVVISIIINKIEVPKAISSTLIAIIILFACECLNMIFLQLINVNPRFLESAAEKIIYGIPSLVLFGIITFLFNLLSKKRRATVI